MNSPCPLNFRIQKSPPNSPPAQRRNPPLRESHGVKAEEAPTTEPSGHQRASQEEQAFVAALWPNGVPPELADFEFPNLERDLQTISPPRSPYYPETEPVSRSPTPVTPVAQTGEAHSEAPKPVAPALDPEAKQFAIQPVVMLERLQLPPPAPHIQDYWEPLGPWLSEVWEVERKKEGFLRALQTCSLQPLHHFDQLRYVIPPLPTPVEGAQPPELANPQDPEIADDALADGPVARSPTEEAPIPPSSGSPGTVVLSRSSRGPFAVRPPLQTPLPPHHPRLPALRARTGKPTAAAAAQTSMEVDGSPHETSRGPLSDILQIDLQADEQASLAGSSVRQTNNSPIPPYTKSDAGETMPPTSPVNQLTGPTPSASGSAPPSSPVIQLTGPTPSTSGSASNTLPVTSVAGQGTVGPSTRVVQASPAAATISTPLLADRDDIRRLPEDSPRGDSLKGDIKRGPKKKRIWCFDCRRHGHPPSDCPNPTGEAFCGKCPYRVAKNRPCPTHKTDLAGAAMSRSANRPAVRSEVFKVSPALESPTVTSRHESIRQEAGRKVGGFQGIAGP
ncbi:vegetative cell wall protein gp1-like [Diachasma alloeum]|uniref:vegetative cell wall protein gp1-like n=1 Tax=Diachasma alloeum TaxID=454923 RepID=UPI00073842E2|nr:vegetative cell wall protein gp1-like [Diachasma alloeum]